MVYTNFGFKNSLAHDGLATKMIKCIQTTELPEWMTKGMTTLIQNYPLKGPPQTIMNL